MTEQNLPDVNRRIKEIMEKEGCNPAFFADTISINRATISNFLNGRVNSRGEKYFPPPSLDVFQNILKTYKNINPDWLILGILPMYKGDKFSLQPDLFNGNAINTVNDAPPAEYAQEMKVEKTENTPKSAIIQEVITTQNTSKKIEKIMIFYSDKTFESFSPDWQ